MSLWPSNQATGCNPVDAGVNPARDFALVAQRMSNWLRTNRLQVRILAGAHFGGMAEWLCIRLLTATKWVRLLLPPRLIRPQSIAAFLPGGTGCSGLPTALAQRREQWVSNPSVPGSNPGCGFAVVAQLGERLSCKQLVAGSIPVDGSIFRKQTGRIRTLFRKQSPARVGGSSPSASSIFTPSSSAVSRRQ